MATWRRRRPSRHWRRCRCGKEQSRAFGQQASTLVERQGRPVSAATTGVEVVRRRCREWATRSGRCPAVEDALHRGGNVDDARGAFGIAQAHALHHLRPGRRRGGSASKARRRQCGIDAVDQRAAIVDQRAARAVDLDFEQQRDRRRRGCAQAVQPDDRATSGRAAGSSRSQRMPWPTRSAAMAVMVACESPVSAASIVRASGPARPQHVKRQSTILPTYRIGVAGDAPHRSASSHSSPPARIHRSHSRSNPAPPDDEPRVLDSRHGPPLCRVSFCRALRVG